jgi:hypothetical protein
MENHRMAINKNAFWKATFSLVDSSRQQELNKELNGLIASIVKAGAIPDDVRRFAECCFSSAAFAGMRRGFRAGWRCAESFSRLRNEDEPAPTIIKMLMRRPNLTVKQIAQRLDRSPVDLAKGNWQTSFRKIQSHGRVIWERACDRKTNKRLAARFDEYTTRLRKLAKRLNNLQQWKRVLLDKKPIKAKTKRKSR